MIESFRHKGLKRLFEDDDRRGVNPQHVRKIRQVLALLQAAENIADLDYPAFRLHPSKPTYKVSGQSPCGQTGELSSGSMTGRLLKWTSWIAIEGGQHHALADEEPAASWRAHR